MPQSLSIELRPDSPVSLDLDQVAGTLTVSAGGDHVTVERVTRVSARISVGERLTVLTYDATE
jgi:hypothetical protein